MAAARAAERTAREVFLKWAKAIGAVVRLFSDRLNGIADRILRKPRRERTVLSMSDRLLIIFSGFRDLGCDESLIGEYRRGIEVVGPGELGRANVWP